MYIVENQSTVAAYCTIHTNPVGGLAKTSFASKGAGMALIDINVRNHNVWTLMGGFRP